MKRTKQVSEARASAQPRMLGAAQLRDAKGGASMVEYASPAQVPTSAWISWDVLGPVKET
jgi:hypothetical protein